MTTRPGAGGDKFRIDIATRVLIVEDDAHIAELLRLHLLEEGYAVAHAADGSLALSKHR